MMVLAAISAVVMAQAPEALVKQSSEKMLVPFYVPRSFRTGFFINSPVATPHFRIQWEGVLIDQPRNQFIWTVLAGSGVGLGVPSPMTAHFQHTALAGFGYRGDYKVISWGFHAGVGPVWYRAFFVPDSGYAADSTVLPYAEGQIQLGIRLHQHLRLGIYGGYGSPFTFRRGSPGNTYVGGVDLGIFVDWR